MMQEKGCAGFLGMLLMLLKDFLILPNSNFHMVYIAYICIYHCFNVYFFSEIIEGRDGAHTICV